MNDPKYTVTNRGFKHMEPVAVLYGSQVLLYESSFAEAPHIYMQAGDPHCPPAVTLTLTAEQAWELKEQLEWLLQLINGSSDSFTVVDSLFA